MKKLFILLSIVTIMLSCNDSTEQQSDFTGSISEYNCDSSKYIGVPGINVKIFDDNTLVTSTKTNENGIFTFKSLVNKRIRLMTETYNIDTIISASNMYETFSNKNGHIKDWNINNENACKDPMCQIGDIIFYNNIIIDNSGIIFEQMNNIWDNSVKKSKVRILNHNELKLVCKIKKKTDLDNDEYWRILSIPSGTEYWFTIEEDSTYIMYDIYNEKIVGNELLVSFSDTIETVERCDYDNF
jgi:hypothetical protein